MGTAAQNLCRYILDEYKTGEGTMEFYLRLFNMSDKELQYAIEEHYDEDDCGLHAEWD